MTGRFRTTTESSQWLLENYGMRISPRTLLRLAKNNIIHTHRTHDRAWYTFTEAALSRHAELQGFRRLS